MPRRGPAGTPRASLAARWPRPICSKKLRRIEALHTGTSSAGEREAGRLAAEPIRARLAEVRGREPDVELVDSLPDPWARNLFVALDSAIRDFPVTAERGAGRAQLAGSTGGELVALGGTTMRHAFDTATGTPALHVVSAWAAESRLVLGQLAVDDDSNEIPALPKLIGMLDLEGAVVTVDAMGAHPQRAQARDVGEAGRRPQAASSGVERKVPGECAEDGNCRGIRCARPGGPGASSRRQRGAPGAGGAAGVVTAPAVESNSH
ncbi:MAG TPA: ISAs1 family transposase [Polyangiaceae bacterium]|nr:ISAs1 family transposase [Polyangiaceae bacterium]